MKTPRLTYAFICSVLLFMFLINAASFAGTTGKISGKIVDSESGEPIVGANIILEGTYLGAAADINGYYYINNIPPGRYTMIASSIGYQKTIVQDVVVKIDLTTKIDIKLSSTSINIGREVVVRAERPLVQKDLTSNTATVSAEDIKMMPVESIGQVVNLQAGVVGGHFRGGRSNEVAYLIDGVSVTDAYNNSMSVEIENTSVRQMEVISGTFNAEYGQAMSGVVNIVTQDGSQNYEGSASAYVGNYVTSHKDLFHNLDKMDRVASQNMQFSFSGPVPYLKGLTFFTTGRYFNDEGYLYGQRIYNVADDAPLPVEVFDGTKMTTDYIMRNTGDGSYVPMNPNKKYSFNGKLTYTLPGLKFSYSLFWDDNYNKYYNHSFFQTPDGIKSHYRNNTINTFQITHVISQSTFHTLQLSTNYNNYYGYLYADPFDSRYVNPRQGLPISNYTFRSGGNEGDRYERYTRTNLLKYTLTSQVSKEHKIGAGLEARMYKLFNHGMSIINLTEDVPDTASHIPGKTLFTLGYMNYGTSSDRGYNTGYLKKPMELSAYIQDKMEYDIMIINAGVRFEYFDPNSSMPGDWKNPRNNPLYPKAGIMTKAEPKFQISPRLGASFPISDKGAIHFSYGHFFQMPNFENLYYNSDFIVNTGTSLSSITGNPDLKGQKTVMYELGLQQVLFPMVSFDLTVYYRDIRDLLGMEIVKTYEGLRYAKYINQDYGNVRGFIVTLEKMFGDYFGAKVDYTYQIAEGNSSDPTAVFNNNQTDPPVATPKRVVPLDWDQRSTLNISLNFGNMSDWSLGLIFNYGTGMPYTEDPLYVNGLIFNNMGVKPSTYNLDLRAEKNFNLGGININTFLLVYNVLDIKNEYGVYGSTGRATSDLNTKRAVPIVGLNTIEDMINNPTMYSTPRQIRLGMSLGF